MKVQSAAVAMAMAFGLLCGACSSSSGRSSAGASCSNVAPCGGNLITSAGDAGDTKHSYCVAGGKMTWTPQSTSPTLTGAIVFQNGGATSTGGTGGTGGGGGTAGAAGTGGAGATGGGGGTGGTAG